MDTYNNDCEPIKVGWFGGKRLFVILILTSHRFVDVRLVRTRIEVSPLRLSLVTTDNHRCVINVEEAHRKLTGALKYVEGYEEKCVT